MEQAILELIAKEDKKNPFTDDELADKLNTSREKITDLRSNLHILNSRERRKEILRSEAVEIFKNNPQISERNFLSKLQEKGFQISRFIASELKAQIQEEILLEKDNLNEKKEESLRDWEEKYIIGATSSLKKHVDRAKAAVLYPPHGLHTLIIGPSGSGKSNLANFMHFYALQTEHLAKSAPFIVFNCADYTYNPQLLISQLFGHIKGAFTGADRDKMGLVERADGGVLFLDEIHRLPNEGQEMLFHLMDFGTFRRLGEAEEFKKVEIMIVAATTETPESTLLLTFRRRIPIVIDLPALDKRSLEERLEMVKRFFCFESSRIGRKITVDREAVKALMFYECQGNIGQLKTDIQVSCARGLLNCVGVGEKNQVTVSIEMLEDHVKKGLLRIHRRGDKLKDNLNSDLIFYPDKTTHVLAKRDRYMLSDEIYEFIERRYQELLSGGMEESEAEAVVDRELEVELKDFAQSISQKRLDIKKELAGFVDESIIEISRKAYEIANRLLDGKISEAFWYSLAIHMESAVDRIAQGDVLLNTKKRKIKRKYPEEYNVARIIGDEIEKHLKLKMPEDELDLIAVYLKSFSRNELVGENKVKVIVLTHGSVAKAMVEVTKSFLGVDYAIPIEMDMDESPESALERTIETVKKCDEGKGCLLLVDMGSLVTFSELITEKTGIPTRVIPRVDTLMVIEAVRKALFIDTELDSLADFLMKNEALVARKKKIKNAKKAILTLCLTGEGTAMTIKKYIEEKLEGILNQIAIIPLGLIVHEGLDERIEVISKDYEIISFVGSIDPGILDIPFISIQEILSGRGLDFLAKTIQSKVKKRSLLNKVIFEEFIEIGVDYKSKEEVIDKMVHKLESKGFVDGQYLLSLYKREAICSSYAKGGIGIPHGSPENVTKPAIFIIKPARPILWDIDLAVSIIVLIAFKENSKEYFNDLYKILLNQEALNLLKNAKTNQEIIEIFDKYTI